MSDEPDPVHKTGEEYGGTFNADLLEQYKLYVQSAENISSNRIATDRYLLTLNTALFALSGFQLSNLDSGYLALAVPAIGMFVSLLWHMLIKSYGNLNRIKFQLIHKLEERLPATLFKTEWEIVKRSDKIYIPVTKIEQWLPRMLAAAHGVLFAVWVLCYLGVIMLA